MATVTGQYDVATEVSGGLVNYVAAAIPENENTADQRLLHSGIVRTDDANRRASDPLPEPEPTGVRATAEVQVSTPTVSLPAEGVAETFCRAAGHLVRRGVWLRRVPTPLLEASWAALVLVGAALTYAAAPFAAAVVLGGLAACGAGRRVLEPTRTSAGSSGSRANIALSALLIVASVLIANWPS